MSLKERNDLLVRIHYLIKRKAVGSPEALAGKLGVSTPTFFRYLDTLKDYGAPIAYCRNRSGYYYTSEFELRFY